MSDFIGVGDKRMSDPMVVARIAELTKVQEWRVGREADAMSAVEEYRDPENGQWKTSLADAAIAEMEAEQSLHDAELDAGTARAEQAEAERDAAWELVEELDPHHLKRNKMGLPREGGEG